MKKVLIVVDGSEYSMEAVKLVKDFKLASTQELHILNVQNYTLPPDSSLKDQGKEIIKESGKILAGEKYIGNVRFGETIDEILDYAEEIKADVIIAGSHGKSGLTSIIMGSTTAKLLSRSKIPVLVFKN